MYKQKKNIFFKFYLITFSKNEWLILCLMQRRGNQLIILTCKNYLHVKVQTLQNQVLLFRVVIDSNFLWYKQ